MLQDIRSGIWTHQSFKVAPEVLGLSGKGNDYQGTRAGTKPQRVASIERVSPSRVLLGTLGERPTIASRLLLDHPRNRREAYHSTVAVKQGARQLGRVGSYIHQRHTVPEHIPFSGVHVKVGARGGCLVDVGGTTVTRDRTVAHGQSNGVAAADT